MSVLATPAILGAILLVSPAAQAREESPVRQDTIAKIQVTDSVDAVESGAIPQQGSYAFQAGYANANTAAVPAAQLTSSPTTAVIPVDRLDNPQTSINSIIADTRIPESELQINQQSENLADLELENLDVESSDNDAVLAEIETDRGMLSELSAENNDAMSQVTSVSQLSDVQPTDWAFQALQSLVERYGCIAGYPDGTFKGNRALSRYEFAAGLNACLDRISELIAAATADLASKEDLAVLQKLQDEFAAELATIRGRVDALEARASELEANQFSTTTKLGAEVIFGFSDAFGDDTDANTVFQDRIRLNFLTSFTGKDLLQTRLQAGNVRPLLTGTLGTQEGRFTYDGPTGNDVELDILRYIFPVGKKLTFQILANDALHHYYADTVNPYFEGLAGGLNSISRFGERNPIYRLGPFGAGAAVAIKPFKKLRIDLGYISNEADDPRASGGLFNGNYSGIAQVVYGDRYKVGLTYVHAYDGSTPARTPPSRFVLGGTGTGLANLSPAFLSAATSLTSAQANTPVVSNAYGIQTSLKFSPKFVMNGWVGKIDARLVGLGDADIWTYAVTLGFPDLFRAGNFGGLVLGAEPTLRGLEVPGAENFDRDFAFHIEAFYKYRVSDNILITPGVIWLTSPNQDSDNGDVVIGTIRTTFTF